MVQLRVRQKEKTFKPKLQAAIDSGNIQDVIDQLTVRQRRFAEEYVLDFNGAAAVTRSGYSAKYPNRTAYELLHNPAVKAAIDQLTEKNASKSTLKPEYVLNKIQRTIEKAELANNHNAVLRGCELLARHLGMFIDRTELTGKDGGPLETRHIEQEAKNFTNLLKQLAEKAKRDHQKIELISTDKI